MRGVEVTYGTAVADHKALETPLAAQYLVEVTRLSAAGHGVYALVCAHHLGHVALLHQPLEGGQIGLPQVALRQVLHIERMSVPLRSAVHGKVLGTGQQLVVPARVGGFTVPHALQTVDHRQSHALRQVWVLAVCLLTAAPARVTEDIDVGCPERQSLVAAYLTLALCLLILHTRLVAGSVKAAIYHVIVKRCRHRHRDGKDGGEAVAAYAMQRLAPPREALQPKTRQRLRLVNHQFCLLLQRQTADEVIGTFLGTQRRVLVRQHSLCRTRQHQQRHRSRHHNLLQFGHITTG